ncbi:MAG: Flp pilus assembly protein CpaB [Gemmataceae bacterium]
MKSRTIVLLALAIGFGLVAAFLTTMMSARPDETVQVVVAKHYIPVHKFMDKPEEYFEVQPKPRSQVPLDYIADLKRIENRMTTRSFSEGDMITENDIEEPKGPIIAPGKRAMAIRVNVESAVAGFVMPHSKVDIIHTKRTNNNMSKAELLLEDMEVLAVDLLTKRPEDKEGIVPATVTLHVTPKEVLELTEARESGSLTLVLRSPSDQDKVKEKLKGIELVDVLVAADDIPANTLLQDTKNEDHDLLKKKQFLATEVPPTAILYKDRETLEGKTIYRPVFSDQFLSSTYFEQSETPPDTNKPAPIPQPRIFVQTVWNGNDSTSREFPILGQRRSLEGTQPKEESKPNKEESSSPPSSQGSEGR